MERKELKKNLEDYRKALYNIDMVEGFVNFGAMANKDYNDLVPTQMQIMDDYLQASESVNLIAEGHDDDAIEFDNYPKHCVLGTPEADFIPEIQKRIYDNNVLVPNVRVYRKNSINGMLNDQVREDIKKMKNLKMVVFNGVCEDLCVMDFVRTYARYMNEINKRVNLYVVANTVDTFDAPGHNRQEWKDIARKVMEQAGVKYLENYEELQDEEKKLGLRK